jgi:hypothetical protein
MSEVLSLIWIAALCLICPIYSNGDRFGYLNVNSLTSTADRILSRSAGSVFSELVYVILCALAWILLCVSDKRRVLLCPALCAPLPFRSVWPQVICVTNLPVLMEPLSLWTSHNLQPTFRIHEFIWTRTLRGVFYGLFFEKFLVRCIFTVFSYIWGAKPSLDAYQAHSIRNSRMHRKQRKVQNLTLPGDSGLKKQNNVSIVNLSV